MKIIRLNSIIGLNTAALAAAIFVLLTTQAAAKPRWEKAKQHWAFQKVKPPTIPSRQVLFNGKLRNWIKNPIDAYVLKELEKQNMVPSKHAEKWSLLRRVYFDLIGLPQASKTCSVL